jgi:hypothetical protein
LINLLSNRGTDDSPLSIDAETGRRSSDLGVSPRSPAPSITQRSGTAHADVCASASGQRVTTTGCVDIAGGIDYYAPPPAYYAPMPKDFDAFPNVTTCICAMGRRGHVTATGCN